VTLLDSSSARKASASEEVMSTSAKPQRRRGGVNDLRAALDGITLRRASDQYLLSLTGEYV